MGWKDVGCSIWAVAWIGGSIACCCLALHYSDEGAPNLYRGALPLSAGFDHSCAVFDSVGLRCWGGNDRGQIGDGSTEQRLSRTPVPGFETGALSLSAGFHSTCAVTPKGKLMCWGANDFGQLGTGTTKDSAVPASVTGLETGTVAVSVGEEFACAIAAAPGTDSRGAKCWGRNQDGRVGDGTDVDKRTPTNVLGLEANVDTVSAGHHHACAIVAGSVKCWGDNSMGQLGDGTRVSKRVPTQAVGLTKGVTSITAGGGHTCAMVSPSVGGTSVPPQVFCWGKNVKGQLGDGTTEQRLVPTQITGFESRVLAISAGSSHTCAITPNDKIWLSVVCWGSNGMRQIGDDADFDRTRPTKVEHINENFDKISAGAYHTCLGTASTKVGCWGNNRSGQLGYGYVNTRVIPQNVD